MATVEEFESFLRYVESRTGTPPVGGSWSELSAMIRQYPDDVLALIDDLRPVVTPQQPPVDTSYERWNNEKRRQYNLLAAQVLHELISTGKKPGEASLEQRRALVAYTGFGGFTDLGTLEHPPYPKEYEEASIELALVSKTGGRLSSAASAIVGRVRDQYFTPLAACTAMWQLALRLAPGVRTALETSAGIGRFFQAMPAGIKASAVELDSFMGQMLVHLYPEVQTHLGTFESYFKAHPKNTFDLVIGNPPYGKRPVEFAHQDLARIEDAVDYFFIRGASYLNPGGLLLLLVPAAFLSGKSHQNARTALLRGTDFRGAALLPSGTFPNVREGTFAVIACTRRSAPKAEQAFDARERAVQSGMYFDLPEAANAICGGEWKNGSRGSYLHGTPDYSKIATVWMAPSHETLPTGAIQAPESPQESPSPGEIRVKPEATPTVSDVVDAAQSATQELASSVRRYLELVAVDPNAAEAMRETIRTAVVEWIGEYGNPHEAKAPPALRAVVTAKGVLEPVLGAPVSETRPFDEPPTSASLDEQIAWWSERRGYATLEDLRLTRVEDALQNPDVCVELHREGPLLYAAWSYMTGAAAGRLATIEAALQNPEVDGLLKARLEAQREMILRQWSSTKTLAEMDVNPRSGFVPQACLEEWVNHEIAPDQRYRRTPIKITFDDVGASIADDDPGLLWVLSNNARLAPRETKADVAVSWTALDFLYWFLGYYNRASRVTDFEGSGVNRGVYKKGEDPIKVDEFWSTKFMDWLTGPGQSWMGQIEAEYNSKMAAPLMSAIPTTPVPLPGQNARVQLHGHQNEAVRRASLGGKPRPTLIAHDVGAGKTFIGNAAAMRWRSMGAARRVLITVPASVLAKWYADARTLFPNGRIAVLGINIERKGRDETPDERLEKWLRFAAGAYDYMICSHEAFLRDLEMDVDEVADILMGVAWARRGQGAKIAKLKRAQQRLVNLREKLVRYEQATSEGSYSILHPRIKGPWAQHRAKSIKDTQKQIETTLEEIENSEALGTAGEVMNLQNVINRYAAKKPYRPGLKKNGEVEDEDEVEETSTSAEPTEGAEDDEDEDAAEALEDDAFKVEDKPRLPGMLSWSKLGVDAVIVDEAHKFKNLWYPAEKIEYAGKGQDQLFSSLRSWDMFLKTASVHRRQGGVGGVMFLTATPMTNSPLELYSLISMVNPQLFPGAGIHNKEGFIDRFWRIETRMTLSSEGAQKPRPALVGFKNLDELSGLISNVLDRKSTAFLVEQGFLKNLPKAQLGAPLMFERDPAQSAIVRTVIGYLRRWGLISSDSPIHRLGPPEFFYVEDGEIVSGGVIPQDDIPDLLKGAEGKQNRNVLTLVAQSILDKAALDPRLIVEYAEGNRAELLELLEKDRLYKEWVEGGKKPWTELDAKGKAKVRKKRERPSQQRIVTLMVAVELLERLSLDKIQEFYQDAEPVKITNLAKNIANNLERPGRGRCGHVVFIDFVGLHEAAAQAIVRETGGRIPRSRIVLLKAGNKAKRLEASTLFNGRDPIEVDGVVIPGIEPAYDVVIGSGGVMSEGIDLQRRSCAVHHLNLPWDPATLHQRNGRAVRQGNLMGSVDLLYYLTQKSFDAVRFDKVARKAAWWEEFFSGQSSTSNPAADKADNNDLEEQLIRMGVEGDDEFVNELIAEARRVREARMYEQQLRDVKKEWVVLNQAFNRARSTVDPVTREIQFNAAVRRRDAFRRNRSGFVIPGALEALNDHPVLVEFESGRLVRVGDVFQSTVQYDGWVGKVLGVEVRGMQPLVQWRLKGQPVSQPWTNEASFFNEITNATPVASWRFEEEVKELVDRLGSGSGRALFKTLARLPSDLWAHAPELLKQTVSAVLGGYGGPRTQISSSVPLLAYSDGQVLVPHPIAAVSSFENDFVESRALFTWIKDNPPLKVYTTAPAHPDAWSVWVEALRDDKVLAVPTGPYGMSPPARLRVSSVESIEDISIKMFGRRPSKEILRQRRGVTGEPDPREKSKSKTSGGPSRNPLLPL